MNIEPGTRTGRRAGSCSRVHSRSKPASLGTSIPKEDAAAGGMASFLSFAGAVSLRLPRELFRAVWGAIRDARAQNKRERLCSQFTDKYTQRAAGHRCQPRPQL